MLVGSGGSNKYSAIEICANLSFARSITGSRQDVSRDPPRYRDPLDGALMTGLSPTTSVKVKTCPWYVRKPLTGALQKVFSINRSNKSNN